MMIHYNDSIGILSQKCRNVEAVRSYVSKFGSINISKAETMMPEVNRRSIQRRFKKTD